MARQKKGISKRVLYITGIMYLILIINIIVFKHADPIESINRLISGDFTPGGYFNTVPFHYGGGKWFDTVDVYGNILAFIPFGIYSQVFFKNKAFLSIFAAFLTSLTFELTQYLLNIGAGDITDIITNTTGALIGIIIYSILKFIFKERITNFLFATLSTVVALGLVLLYLS